MIATLTGSIAEKIGELIVIDVQGVGYGLLVPLEDANKVANGDKAKFYVHEHIREDSHDLYGFTEQRTKELFEQLLSVKNVGPKVALAVLGIGNDAVVRSAIASGDIKLLQSAKGVGKRAAEQIVVELRDKVGLVASETAEGIVARGGVNPADEALQALVALGYSEADAMRALHGIDSSLPVEVRVKQALGAK
jgi:Holliday junction DNA helicase RuvA